ncbi:MAG: Ig-like domain-containing protein [Terriglobales bacterium]|jgi:hypothetical protein
MSTRRRFTGKKLPLTLAFGVLVAAAIGAACNGFFQPKTLSSIAIQPPSPQVQVGQSAGLQAYGTYSDTSKSLLTSGVAWTSTGQDVSVNIDANTGQITGVAPGGTATITASAQGVSATATATAYLGNVTDLTVCSGTFNTGTCPASTWTISGSKGGSNDYYAKATSAGTPVDVTVVASWSVSPTPTAGTIVCLNSVSPAVCTLTPTVTQTGPYVITVTYPGTTPATANITVTQ